MNSTLPGLRSKRICGEPSCIRLFLKLGLSPRLLFYPESKNMYEMLTDLLFGHQIEI